LKENLWHWTASERKCQKSLNSSIYEGNLTFTEIIPKVINTANFFSGRSHTEHWIESFRFPWLKIGRGQKLQANYQNHWYQMVPHILLVVYIKQDARSKNWDTINVFMFSLNALRQELQKTMCTPRGLSIVRLCNHWDSKFSISVATFTRVQTNFFTDKNLHGSTLRLHGIGGRGRTFEQLSVQVRELFFFSGPKLAHLAIKKFVQLRGPM